MKEGDDTMQHLDLAIPAVSLIGGGAIFVACSEPQVTDALGDLKGHSGFLATHIHEIRMAGAPHSVDDDRAIFRQVRDTIGRDGAIRTVIFVSEMDCRAWAFHSYWVGRNCTQVAEISPKLTVIGIVLKPQRAGGEYVPEIQYRRDAVEPESSDFVPSAGHEPGFSLTVFDFGSSSAGPGVAC